MDYPVLAPEFAGKSVVVRVSGMFADPQVIVDGAPVKAEDGQYSVTQANAGSSPTSLRLRAPLLDFVPVVFVDDRRVIIAPALMWWQYLWTLLPTILLIVIVRGVLPALAGLALSYFCVYLIRSRASRAYLWSACINLGVFAAIAGLIAVRIAARHTGLSH